MSYENTITNRHPNATTNPRILKTIAEYVETFGLDAASREVDVLTSKDVSELFHIVYEKAAQNGIYPNAYNCRNHVKYFIADVYHVARYKQANGLD